VEILRSAYSPQPDTRVKARSSRPLMMPAAEGDALDAFVSRLQEKGTLQTITKLSRRDANVLIGPG
jgi:hypothetical protein